MTSTNTRIGATALSADTNTLPMKAVDFATSGANRARAIPAIRPMMICVTRLLRFRRCKREGDEAVITVSLILLGCRVPWLMQQKAGQATWREPKGSPH